MNTSTLKFITGILNDTLRIDFHYYLYPYHDLATFDRGLRNSLEDSEQHHQDFLQRIQTLHPETIYLYTDSYSLNYAILLPYAEKKDLIVVGPYFENPIDQTYWNQVTLQHHLTLRHIDNLKGFLYSIPVIDNNLTVISTITDILTYINPESEAFSLEYIGSSSIDKSIASDGLSFAPEDEFDAYMEAVEKRYELEHDLLSSICDGNWKEALYQADKMVHSPFAPRVASSLREVKSLLVVANTLFRKAVEPNGIHPIHLHELSSKHVHLIEKSTTVSQLHSLYEKMIRNYCFLVQNKSTKQYSPIIRQALHHIEFNFNQAILLEELAEKLNISVPHLSNQFKKETGTTIVKYMNHLRIQAALRLLNTSSISIQDIASHVGIADNNYFTKVFKQEVGMTPTGYKKSLSSQTSTT